METPRLTLREFRPDDLDELEIILSDSLVMEFSSKGPLSRKDTSNFINWCIESYENNGYGQWAVIDRETESLIGLCALT
ncbi:MAG: GNAT family N-acetyltransferase [Candidatus Thiodiazotropha sp. (ex Rostrolucina anterorostrata)]|nr:GNAT family N-acetyltransferase [Candidatus Thiodiazotropha sp. (ex Rostrolucina anterorostrata)]